MGLSQAGRRGDVVDIVKGLIGSFGAAACFACLFNTPRRCVLPASLGAMAGYGFYMAFMALFGAPVGATFSGAFVVAVLAELLARAQKAPAIIYALIGIVPLVPGAGLYRTMLMLVLREYGSAAAVGVETVLSAGGIALAIAVVAVFARMRPVRPPVRGKDD